MNTQPYFNEDTTHYMKRQNKGVSLSRTQKIILTELLRTNNNNDGLTRRMLVAKLGLPRTTVYDNLIILKKLRLIDRKELHKINTEPGRPQVLWYIKNKES